MARTAKVFKNLSNLFSEDDIVDESIIEEFEISCEFVYEIESNAIYVVDKRQELYFTQVFRATIVNGMKYKKKGLFDGKFKVS